MIVRAMTLYATIFSIMQGNFLKFYFGCFFRLKMLARSDDKIIERSISHSSFSFAILIFLSTITCDHTCFSTFKNFLVLVDLCFGFVQCIKLCPICHSPRAIKRRSKLNSVIASPMRPERYRSTRLLLSWGDIPIIRSL